MSACISLHCDRQSQYGTCPTVFWSGAQTVEEAHAAGTRIGWRVLPDGRTYCPPCSGYRPTTSSITRLHPLKGTDRA